MSNGMTPEIEAEVKFKQLQERVYSGLEGYVSADELEEDLKFLQKYIGGTLNSFAYIFTACDDKKILKKFYHLISKYDVYGGTGEAEEALDEVKWEVKKLKVFEDLG